MKLTHLVPILVRVGCLGVAFNLPPWGLRISDFVEQFLWPCIWKYEFLGQALCQGRITELFLILC